MGDKPQKPARKSAAPSASASKSPHEKSPHEGERIAKVMARHGLCSRRQAEEWIADGRVSVNGKPVTSPALNVTEDDKIVVDGEELQARSGTRLWLYHKPAGRVVTEKDPEGRPTIFEELAQKGLPRVLTVGRLDINTEGLLLLTNDGGLKRVLELPTTGWLRRYRVRAHGRTTQAQLDRLKKGTTIDGIKYGSIDARLEREQGSNVWINVALREGKNREIKIVFGAMDLQVNRLIRISYGPFQLGDLAVSAVETVKSKTLKDQLGDRLSSEAGVDFDAPMPEPLPPKLMPRLARKMPSAAAVRKRDEAGPDRQDTNRPVRANAKPRSGPKAKQRRPGSDPTAERGPYDPSPKPKPRNAYSARRAKKRGDRAEFDERSGAEKSANSRRVLFDDGRSENFQLAPKKPKRGDKDRPSGPGGPRGPRKSGDARPSGDRASAPNRSGPNKSGPHKGRSR